MSAYLIRTIVPYFFLSWMLLSVILFVQQAGRFSDIFFSVNIPATLVWQRPGPDGGLEAALFDVRAMRAEHRP
jgi:hypothetical protein